MESQVSALLKERNDVPDDNEDEGTESHHEPSPSSPEPPPSPPPSPVPTHYPAMQNLSQQTEQLPVQYSAQQSVDQNTNMDLNKPTGTDRANGVSQLIDSSTMENSQQTSNCLPIKHSNFQIRVQKVGDYPKRH